MIKYKLICKDCEFCFDSWFASSQEFEKLKKLMNSFSLKKTDTDIIRYKEFNKKIKEYQNFIKKNFDYVGKNFAYEARSIHYDNKKKTKGIYGIASKDEIKELKEEGIEASTIPWIEDKKN